MTRPKIIADNWYDWPQYYDMAFRSDTPMEADFIEAASRKYATGRVRRLVEPACGSGRLVVEMASRGYAVTGLDLSRPALRYAKRRLGQRGLDATVVEADMADFRLAKPADAAYCLVDSFRHLLTEDSARRHLECVAEALRPGGIYILGIHLLPPDADEECTERWTAVAGPTRLSVTLRVTATDRRRRIESLRISMLARSAGRNGRSDRELRLRDEFDLRMYTAAQFRRLLASAPSFELCDVYDFWYDITEPLKFDNVISDIVFILKKRG